MAKVKGFRSRKEEKKLARLQKKEKRVQHLRRKSKTSKNEDDQERQRLLRKKTAMLKKKKQDKKRDNMKQGQRLAIKMEDKVIKEMERKLKLKRRKDGRLPNSFYADGLGDILDFIDKRVDPDADLNEQPVDEETSENEGEDFDSEEDCLTEEEDHDEDMVEGSLDLSDEDDTEETKTDLYGNLVDKKGRVIPKTTQEQVVQEDQELDKDLLRKIRGQLNRLTSFNLPGISNFIEALYKSNSLFQVNQCICQCIHDLVIIDITLSPLKLVSELTLLVCVLHENIGEEVGGHAINFFVKAFHSLFEMRHESSDDDKRIDNALSIICYLYAEHLIDVGLFSQIVSLIIQDFSDKSIQLLMFVLTTTGFVMRKDSPDSLKNIIKQIQCKTEERSAAKGHCLDSNKRIDFMLETLTAIKNNNILKVTSKSAGFVHPIDRDELKNALKASLKKTTKVTPITATLNQALSSNRWWIKVGCLLENEISDERDSRNRSSNKDSREVSEEALTGNEEKLCRSLRLNTTPLRRSLFKAIMTSSDFIEASDRIVSLCQKTQMMEAATVLLQVAIHEKTFNPFYIVLAKRLGVFDRKYKLALFFAIRDCLSEIHDMKDSKRTVFATFIFHLVKEKVISLSVLKVFDFSDISEERMTFMKQILELIMSEEEAVMKDIFDRIPKKDHQFASSIRLFISCFMDNSASESATRDLLKAKIKLGKQLSLS